MLKMIVAVDQGNAIGWSDGRLPWKASADLKRFKELTTGGKVVMGWNTFKSLSKPDGLPNRENIVLTRKPLYEVRKHAGENITVASSLMWVEATQECLGCTPPDYWIIGGADVYGQVIRRRLIDEIYLTLVHENSGADVVLPFDLAAWKLFVLRQERLGVCWNLTLMETPPVSHGPTVTFLTLKKTSTKLL